jgi:uncharacterized damage-inducible protein DinB
MATTGLSGHFVAMAGNNAWSNHRLLTACKELTADEFAERRTGFFPSLRATLNHILWVDTYYIDALHRDPTVLKRYDDPPPDFPDAQQLYEAQRRSGPTAPRRHRAWPRSWNTFSSTKSITAAKPTPC